jgi:hypothetical protein
MLVCPKVAESLCSHNSVALLITQIVRLSYPLSPLIMREGVLNLNRKE